MPRRTLTDGMASALGGMNSGQEPSLLKPDELSYALNCTLRGGYPKSRPIYRKRTLTFPNIEVRFWFNKYLLQGGEIFHGPFGDLLIASVAGRLFAIDKQFKVSEITPQRVSTV